MIVYEEESGPTWGVLLVCAFWLGFVLLTVYVCHEEPDQQTDRSSVHAEHH